MTRIICNWKNFDDTTFLEDISFFRPDDVFYHCDTVQPEFLRTVLEQKGAPGYIVNDNAYEVQIPGHTIYTAPFRGLGIQNMHMKDKVLLDPAHTLNTDFAVNFCINKKQINRYLAIKFIEIFGVDKFAYTWSGTGKDFDLSGIFNELENRDPECDIVSKNIRCQITVPPSIEPLFVSINPKQQNNGSHIHPYGTNFGTWNAGLKDIFNRSAVSLITESVTFTHSSVFTEKTLYSIYGLTFPLFIGGYGMIDSMSKLGFDVFDDILDHSYQYKPTLIERCYQAFNFNQHLLRDHKTLKQLRQQCLPRLLANRRSLYDGFMFSRIKQKIQDWPPTLQQIMRPYWSFLG